MNPTVSVTWYFNMEFVRSYLARILGAALLLLAVLFANSVYAVVEIYEFDSVEQEKLYQSLASELRCPKCQNQNLIGSDSQIAKDLRAEVYRLLKEGKTGPEIKEYMVARYGEYVLYKPKLQGKTYILWFGPAVLLLIGVSVLAMIVKRRKTTEVVETNTEISDQEQARLQAMLNNPEFNGKD